MLGRASGDADAFDGVDVVDRRGVVLAVRFADQIDAGDDAQEPFEAVEMAVRAVRSDERTAEDKAARDQCGGGEDVTAEPGAVVGPDDVPNGHAGRHVKLPSVGSGSRLV
ncbi:hypothetical protein J2Z21_000700 [Streptomyces griseochromogenes]|uniref:Uncharacterized protein n=1 Tax=Streptomyces griseochromogenes TaxID=68214 RepID=A0A1B1B2N6_9ACTN|nr:hypothetical protein [Streptomyces griseochromogenes]ANP53088.1 hypothetical protein AVL59_29270 [Streptomyces griseochromogenes]MBP2047778.1 hypothetical protein [Streptomyces griseochromogenes]